MAKDPRYRYASCGEFARALSASLAFTPPGPPRLRGWWVAAALAVAVAVVAAVVVVVVVVVKGRSDGDDQAAPSEVMAWDDTLYPQEIPSVFRAVARYELLRFVSARPEPVWTTPVGDSPPDVVGGDDTIVMLRHGTYLTGLAADTGAPRWPSVDLHVAPVSCAVHMNRIGCVASAGAGSDSSVFFLDAGSGDLLRTVKVPNRDLRWIAVAGDRFVVTPDGVTSDDKGFAAGYTTEGDEVWTRDGNEGMYVVASQRVLVDGTPSGDEVSFVSTDDGRVVLRSTRAREGRDMTWNVFHGGIAIQNEDWTGTDIYDVDGKKRSSVVGWQPVGYQSVYTTASPLPLLARLKETRYPDDQTIAAANPETGHLLWRISGPELTHQVATAYDKLMVKVNAPTTGRDVIRVYDAYSGEPVSPPIDMTASVSVEVYWIRTDGDRLVYNYIDSSTGYSEAAYLIATGEKSWEIPLASSLPPATGLSACSDKSARRVWSGVVIMAGVKEVEVVVAHHECATLRVGDVFLKVDSDQARTDVEVEAMAMAPVPTPEVLWRKPPVLALAALRGTTIARLGEPSTASPAAWAAVGAAVRKLHDAPPPWARSRPRGVQGSPRR
jgi:hypothetical protein